MHACIGTECGHPVLGCVHVERGNCISSCHADMVPSLAEPRPPHLSSHCRLNGTLLRPALPLYWDQVIPALLAGFCIVLVLVGGILV